MAGTSDYLHLANGNIESFVTDAILETFGSTNNNRFMNIYANEPTTIASAANLTIPANANVRFNIAGTTPITSIAASRKDRIIVLFFGEFLTIINGSNLKLNGDFTARPYSTLTLICDGTNWIEIGRKL